MESKAVMEMVLLLACIQGNNSPRCSQRANMAGRALELHWKQRLFCRTVCFADVKDAFCLGRKWHGIEMAWDCVYGLPYTASASPDSMFQGEQVGKSCFLVHGCEQVA